MKINSEQKCIRKKNRNRKRSKKRRGNRKKFKYQKSHMTRREPMPVHVGTMDGESYWKNYNNALRWQRNYLDYINSCHLSPETSFIFNTSSVWTPSSGTRTTDCSSSEVVDSINESNSEYQDLLYDEEEEEEEFEVTEEMMDFLEQSMKHKEAMKLMRAEADLVSNESKEVEKPPEKGRDDIEECQTPKENMIDEKRILEMSKLYGKSSPMILGMETALQLTFNKNCDVYKPAFWPCLPLKIQFDNK